MIKILFDGIFFEFNSEDDYINWVLKLEPSDVYTIIEEEYEYDEVDISELEDDETNDSIPPEEATKRYSDKPICEHCNNGPVISKDQFGATGCPVCQSGSIFV